MAKRHPTLEHPLLTVADAAEITGVCTKWVFLTETAKSPTALRKCARALRPLLSPIPTAA